jgi:hypothetical protein
MRLNGTRSNLVICVIGLSDERQYRQNVYSAIIGAEQQGANLCRGVDDIAGSGA